MFLLAITLMVSTRECLCNCWDRPRQRTGHMRNCPALTQQRLLTDEITHYYRHCTQPCSLYLLNVIPWFAKEPVSQINFKSTAWVSKESGVKFTKPLLPPRFMCFFHSFPIESSAGIYETILTSRAQSEPGCALPWLPALSSTPGDSERSHMAVPASSQGPREPSHGPGALPAVLKLKRWPSSIR